MCTSPSFFFFFFSSSFLKVHFCRSPKWLPGEPSAVSFITTCTMCYVAIILCHKKTSKLKIDYWKKIWTLFNRFAHRFSSFLLALSYQQTKKKYSFWKKKIKNGIRSGSWISSSSTHRSSRSQRSNTTRICRQEQEERDCPTVKAFCQVSVKIYISCSTNWFRIKPVKGEKNWKKSYRIRSISR